MSFTLKPSKPCTHPGGNRCDKHQRPAWEGNNAAKRVIKGRTFDMWEKIRNAKKLKTFRELSIVTLEEEQARIGEKKPPAPDMTGEGV